jgi:hypothetical protein
MRLSTLVVGAPFLALAIPVAAAKTTKAEVDSWMTRGNERMTAGARLLSLGEKKRAGKAFAEGREIYTKVLAELPRVKLRQPSRLAYWINVHWNLACSRALQGQKERAIDAVERLLSAGFDTWIQLRKERDFDSIREHPRFKAAVRLAKTAQALRRRYLPLLEKKAELFPYQLKASATDGSVVDLSTLRGKLVLIHVTVDLQAARDLATLQRMFGRRLTVVALVPKDTLDAEVLKKHLLLPFKTVEATKAQLEAANSTPLPTTLFLDKAGRVRFQARRASELPLKWLILRLLDLEEPK